MDAPKKAAMAAQRIAKVTVRIFFNIQNTMRGRTKRRSPVFLIQDSGWNLEASMGMVSAMRSPTVRSTRPVMMKFSF